MIKRIVVAVCTVVIGGLFLIFGADISAGIRSGISVCGDVVIPSLFPFMILAEFVALSGASDTLSKPISPFTRWLFGFPKVTAAPILLSFISGYPVGASLARRLYDSGKILRSDAEKMLTFTVNSSPAMLIFAVGMGMLGGKEYGYLLYIVHILASVLNGILFSRIILNFGKKGVFANANLSNSSIFSTQNRAQTGDQKSACGITKKDDTPHYNIADAFVTATADASVSMLKICGCVILFAGIVASIKYARILALILEVTVGCKVAINYGIKAISAVVGFGGISVIMQVMTVSKGLIRPWILILSRITHAAISYGLCSVAVSLLPEKTVAVLSTGLPQLDSFTSVTAPASAAMLLLAVVVMFSAKIANAR